MENKEKPNLALVNEMVWRVNTPALFNEILSNPGTSILSVPFKILAQILGQVGERCAELNDPVLNSLMCRLAVYEISDPYNENYDKELTAETIKKGLR